MSYALLVLTNSGDRIIDTGATNHIVSDVNILDKQTITKNSNSKKVFLPNGDIYLVTHSGDNFKSAQNTLHNVFHLPQFKFNLLSVFKASTKELYYVVLLYLD